MPPLGKNVKTVDESKMRMPITVDNINVRLLQREPDEVMKKGAGIEEHLGNTATDMKVGERRKGEIKVVERKVLLKKNEDIRDVADDSFLPEMVAEQNRSSESTPSSDEVRKRLSKVGQVPGVVTNNRQVVNHDRDSGLTPVMAPLEAGTHDDEANIPLFVMEQNSCISRVGSPRPLPRSNSISYQTHPKQVQVRLKEQPVSNLPVRLQEQSVSNLPARQQEQSVPNLQVRLQEQSVSQLQTRQQEPSVSNLQVRLQEQSVSSLPLRDQMQVVKVKEEESENIPLLVVENSRIFEADPIVRRHLVKTPLNTSDEDMIPTLVEEQNKPPNRKLSIKSSSVVSFQATVNGHENLPEEKIPIVVNTPERTAILGRDNASTTEVSQSEHPGAMAAPPTPDQQPANPAELLDRKALNQSSPIREKTPEYKLPLRVKTPDSMMRVKTPDSIMRVKTPDSIMRVKTPDSIMRVKTPEQLNIHSNVEENDIDLDKDDYFSDDFDEPVSPPPCDEEITLVPDTPEEEKELNMNKRQFYTRANYGRLWEFIRDLLKNEKYCPSIIKWENVEEGQFRIVDSEGFANLWATVKGNKKMNYEKLSRAMRYYYKVGIFEVVPNKRLVYKFGKGATGWKPQPEGFYNQDMLEGRNVRCEKCLCVFRSFLSLQQHHAQTCAGKPVAISHSEQAFKDMRTLQVKNTEDLDHLQLNSSIQGNMTPTNLLLGNILIPVKQQIGTINALPDTDMIMNKQEEGEPEPSLTCTITPQQGFGVAAAPMTITLKPMAEITPLKSKPSLTSSKKLSEQQQAAETLISLSSNNGGQMTNSQSEDMKTQHLYNKLEEALKTGIAGRSEAAKLIASRIENGQLQKGLKQLNDLSNSVPNLVPLTVPDMIPSTVTDINKMPQDVNRYLENQRKGSPQQSLHMSGCIVSTANGGHIDNRQISSPEIRQQPSPDLLSSYYKNAAEKSKTYTILQRRVGQTFNSDSEVSKSPIPITVQPGQESDDEIEIVKIVHTPSEERPPPVFPKLSQQSLTRDNIIKSLQSATASPKEFLQNQRLTENHSMVEAASELNESEDVTMQNAPLDLSSTIEQSRPLDLSPPLKRLSDDSDHAPMSPKKQKMDTDVNLDNIDVAENGLCKMEHSAEGDIMNVVIAGLWQFLRAILHNPDTNPKIITWENMDEGMFRIPSLSEFYKLWKQVKKTSIGYDILKKSIEYYENKKIMHSVPNLRSVYKFGENAFDWKPQDKEICFAGKLPVPNQANWASSRFFNEFPVGLALSDNLGELKPKDINSAIRRVSNDHGQNYGLIEKKTQKLEELFAKMKGPKISKGPEENNLANKMNIGMNGANYETLPQFATNFIENKHKPAYAGQSGLSVNHEATEYTCKLIVPKDRRRKVVLEVDGITINLDPSLFSGLGKGKPVTKGKQDMAILSTKMEKLVAAQLNQSSKKSKTDELRKMRKIKPRRRKSSASQESTVRQPLMVKTTEAKGSANPTPTSNLTTAELLALFQMKSNAAAYEPVTTSIIPTTTPTSQDELSTKVKNSLCLSPPNHHNNIKSMPVMDSMDESYGSMGRSMPSLNIEIPQTKPVLCTSEQKSTSPGIVTSHLRRSLEAPSPNKIPTPQPSPKLLRLVSSSLPSPPKCSTFETLPTNEPSSISQFENKFAESAIIESKNRLPLVETTQSEPRHKLPSADEVRQHLLEIPNTEPKQQLPETYEAKQQAPETPHTEARHRLPLIVAKEPEMRHRLPTMVPQEPEMRHRLPTMVPQASRTLQKMVVPKPPSPKKDNAKKSEGILLSQLTKSV